MRMIGFTFLLVLNAVALATGVTILAVGALRLLGAI